MGGFPFSFQHITKKKKTMVLAQNSRANNMTIEFNNIRFRSICT